MTLLIAYMLLWHVGDVDTFHWIGVTILWVLHVVTHDAPSSNQIRRIIQEEMRK